MARAPENIVGRLHAQLTNLHEIATAQDLASTSPKDFQESVARVLGLLGAVAESAAKALEPQLVEYERRALVAEIRVRKAG
jgi:hypothetical protein